MIEAKDMLFDVPRIMRDPLGYIMDVTRKHGDVVGFDLQGQTAFIVNHPDAIQHVLVNNSRNYTKQTVQFKTLSMVTGNGLLNSDGEFWLQQRRLAQPAFHRKKLMRLGGFMSDSAENFSQQWETKQEIDMEHEMLALSLPVICQALFSLDINDHAEELLRSVNRTLDYVMFRARMPFSWAGKLPLKINRDYNDCIEYVDDWILRLVTHRQQSAEQHDDLLQMLLEARDEAGNPLPHVVIRDEIITMIVAGYETVATGMTWMWYLLDKYPAVAATVRAELKTVLNGRTPTLEDLPNLPQLHMAMEESWRLYPPAWVVSRQALADDTLMGQPVPAGSMMIISPYVMHRHPDYWPDPERFMLGRFSAENKKAQHSYAFVPFGGGARLCIGNRFAEMETMIVMGTLLQRYQAMCSPTHKLGLSPLVTIRPKNGLPMRLQRVATQ